MVLFGQSGCIWVKWSYSGKSGCIRAKVVVFGQKWLYSGKSSCILAKVVVFGQKWFFPCKSRCIQEKVVAFREIGFIRGNCLYFAVMVLFGQKYL